MKHIFIPYFTGALAMLFAARPATAHEHWVIADMLQPAGNSNVTIQVCSGHYFPKSAFALKDNVLHSVAIIDPAGTQTPIQTEMLNKHRTGHFLVTQPGVHLITCVLKRTRAPEPSYEATTIMAAGGSDDPTRYSRGQGLELVPAARLSALAPGLTLPLMLQLDGHPVAGSMEVVPANGKTAFLKCTATEPAEIQISKAGRYLVTARIKGRGCSLVFQVRNKE